MASLLLELSFNGNSIGKTEEIQDQLEEFKRKWDSLLAKFENKFFVEYKDEVWVLAPPNSSVEIDTSDSAGMDKGEPNFSRYVFKFLENIKEMNGDSDFSFGQEGLVKEFYSDIITFFNIPGVSFCATVSSYDGYYSGTFETYEDGVVWDFVFYEHEEDDDY